MIKRDVIGCDVTRVEYLSPFPLGVRCAIPVQEAGLSVGTMITLV